MTVTKISDVASILLLAEGEACLDMMSDLAASEEFDLELLAVSTDSLPVHRSLEPRTTNPLCNFSLSGFGGIRGRGEAP